MLSKQLKFNIKSTGDGSPFLWGHGLLASIASEDALGFYCWEKFRQNNKLIRYDARGHGKTEATYCPEDYHWQNLATDMLAVADSCALERFSAGGQSMGCATALYAGLLAPNRIDKLVLMNPPTAWETRAAQSAFYNKLAKVGGLLGGKLLAKLMSRKLERLLPGWLITAKSESVAGVLEGLKPLKRKTLANLFKGAALTDFPSREEIKTINIPTLTLGWAGDPSHPLESAIELDRLLPQSTLVVAENYAEFSQWPGLIRDFLSK